MIINSKIKKIIFFVIFLVIFIYIIIPFSQKYYDFHKEKVLIKNKQNILQEELKNFNIEKIKFLENTSIFYSLSKKNIAKKIIEKIKTAKKNIYIELFLFTHKNIRQALLQAKKR
jgi:phosphatidylserine/phosphatidylglycerophosphate/cardiolipin synthase-like enzyme